MQTDWDEIHQERWKVCLFISLTNLGRLKGAGGSLLWRLEVVPNGISTLQTPATHNNLKTSLWPGDMERRRASVGLIKLSNGYNRSYRSQRPHYSHLSLLSHFTDCCRISRNASFCKRVRKQLNLLSVVEE